eukprot:NODE_17448_length_942_cov_2.226994.p5 GENE.NODE_17448_length_942_cov_2.226994~~NODE_17448_length_942_cov_2.226994.p5  ORF type:complete len:58 (-),score=1.82 NODE_17448_length_942_cov_2.226994:330-503(-)
MHRKFNQQRDVHVHVHVQPPPKKDVVNNRGRGIRVCRFGIPTNATASIRSLTIPWPS